MSVNSTGDWVTWSSRKRISIGLLWLAVVAYWCTGPIVAGNPMAGTGMVFIAGVFTALVHGVLRYGMKGALMFALLASVVSLSTENASVLTGLPFGFYHYTIKAGPLVGVVPGSVALIYIAVGYLSWTVGNLILDRMDERLRGGNIILLPIVAAFVMVQFDLVQDPATSTYFGMWIWKNAGGFFGVPLSNFLGWYMTAWIFMQLFTLFLAVGARSRKPQSQEGLLFWLPPVLMYAGIGVSYIWQYRAVEDRVLTDLAGHSWHLGDLYETAVIVMLFTMLPSVVIAIAHLIGWTDRGHRTLESKGDNP